MGELNKAAADYCEALRGNDTNGVGIVALHRVMAPWEHDIEPYADAVPSLLKFVNEAMEREPDNPDLRKCRALILRKRGSKEEK